jgi:hypothetical protein
LSHILLYAEPILQDDSYREQIQYQASASSRLRRFELIVIPLQGLVHGEHCDIRVSRLTAGILNPWTISCREAYRWSFSKSTALEHPQRRRGKAWVSHQVDSEKTPRTCGIGSLKSSDQGSVLFKGLSRSRVTSHRTIAPQHSAETFPFLSPLSKRIKAITISVDDLTPLGQILT